MLSDSTIRQINRQIQDELRQADRSFSSDQDRAAALDRAEKLMSLLSQQTTETIDMDQLADAIIVKLTKPQTPEVHPLATLIETFIARRR